MNSLKTDILGGFPWVLDDFRWHHDATRAAIEALVEGLAPNGTNARIIGVEITGSGANLDVSAGYLWVDGELIQVDAHTVPNLELGADYYHVQITETFDPAGLKSLEDGGTADAYRKRRATIVTGNFPVGSDIQFNTANFPTLPEAITQESSEFASVWQTMSSPVNPSSNLDGFNAGSFIRYKKVGRVCFMMMKLSLDLNTDANTVSFDPPAGIVPQNQHDICCTKIVDDLVTHVGLISVTTTPKLVISVLSGTMESAAPVSVEASFSFPCLP